MKAFAIMFFMLGLIALANFSSDQSFEMSNNQDATLAMQFVTYRHAVHKNFLQAPMPGIIKDTDLKLPYQNKIWVNRIIQGNGKYYCYVYGAASAAQINAVQKLMKGNAAIGQAQNGKLIRLGTAIIIPNFIPDNNIVSVISLDG